MNVEIKNMDEGKAYIENVKGNIIAELLFYQLMKEPEQVRRKLYSMLINDNQKAKSQYSRT